MKEKLSTQMKRKSETKEPLKSEYDGNFGTVISTGSTLLDLAISGGRVSGGGLPGGILVEVFGVPGSGKTVLLSEIAGAVQRQGGEIIFSDPESRLNKQFSALFGLKINEKNYSIPKTVTEVFTSVRKWSPENRKVINGIFTDSLAALSTDTEMEDGDPFGGRRAKEFSEQLRITCREIKEKNYLMVASNQVREVIGATQYQAKTKTTGGIAISFYSSVRLQFSNPKKITEELKIAGKTVKRVLGIETTVEVYKNSVWSPYRTAPLTIYFDYGIDNIRENLQYIKDYTENKTYTCKDADIGNSMEKAIRNIEENNLEADLTENVIDLWEEIENKFKQERKTKLR